MALKFPRPDSILLVSFGSRPGVSWRGIRPLEAPGFSRERCHIPSKYNQNDLRHTAAALLLLIGVYPKKVSEMLGHSPVAITLTIYRHVHPSMHRDAATAMDELFPPVAQKNAQ